MNLTSTFRRLFASVKLAIVIVLRPFRRLLGRVLQVVEHDQMQRLGDETARLSSASVESVTYLGGEVRELDRRLARLEEELAAIRRLIEEQGASEDDRPASPSAASSA